MMNMCKEMMGNMGMEGMMQKGMGMAQNCMGSMGGSDEDAPEETPSKDAAESEKTETKASAKTK